MPPSGRRKPINTFAIVYYGSTGSTWLIATLKNSKGVYVPAFEPLESWQWKTDDAAKLAWLRNAYHPPADRRDAAALADWVDGFRAGPEFRGAPKRPFHTTGIKITPDAVADRGPLLDLFAEHRTRLVFIQRDNRIKHALSLYRHHEEGKSQFVRSGLQKPTRVKMRRFQHWLDESHRQHQGSEAFRSAAVDRLGGDEVTAVEYARLLTGEGKAETIAAVAGYLGLSEPRLAASGFEKSTPDDLEAAVANYAALARRHRDTEHARFFMQ